MTRAGADLSGVHAVRTPEDVDRLMGKLEAGRRDPQLSPSSARIMDRLPDINRMFASERFEDILQALEGDRSDWAQQQLTILQTKSPLSCKVTLRLLMVSPHVGSFADEMRLEFGIVHRLFRQHDFIEGVRALLIDKDNRPQWNPATPIEVTDALVNSIFAPLPRARAWTPLPLQGN